MARPLADLRVVDFSQYMAGPLAGAKLGDLGADVIKVERPIGEGGRGAAAAGCRLGGESPTFMSFNRSKRGVVLDLKQPAGREAARRLARTADVLIENFRPGVMDRLGMGYESLAEEAPRLIYCSATGYGLGGPLSDRPGQDLLVQSVAGLARNTGRADDPPTAAGATLVDAAMANLIAFGIVTALYEREQTGRGRHVEVNLLASLLDVMTHEITTYLNCGKRPERSADGIAHVYLAAPYGIYETSDSFLAIAQTPLPKLAALIDRPDLAEFRTIEDAYRNRDAVCRTLTEVFRERTTEAWLDLLLPAGIWIGPVLDFDGLFATGHPQVAGMIATFDHPSAGRVQVPGPPVRFDSEAVTELRPPPLLGQDTAEILGEVGYSPAEIDELVASGAAAVHEAGAVRRHEGIAAEAT